MINVATNQTLENAVRILDEIYTSERYELSPINNKKNNKDYYLIIHFPEINITNSQGESHIIRDLYVRTVILLNPYRYWFGKNNNFSGTRTTFTLEECASGYSHSHLHPGTIIHEFNNEFCLGSGPIAVLFNEHSMENGKAIDNNDDFINAFYSFLYTVNSYVSWESLEGMPYFKLRNILSLNNKISYGAPFSYNHFKENITTLSGYYHNSIPYIMTHIDKFKINYIATKNRFKIISWKLSKENYEDLSNDVLLIKQNNTYRKFNSSSNNSYNHADIEAQANHFINETASVNFKGKNIQPCIFKEDTKEQQEIIYELNPSFVDLFEEYINYIYLKHDNKNTSSGNTR